jgi:hypothetical protein
MHLRTYTAGVVSIDNRNVSGPFESKVGGHKADGCEWGECHAKEAMHACKKLC